MDIQTTMEIARELIDRVKRDSLSLTVTIDADDRVEIMVSPYESYQPTCPYAKRGCVEEDDGK